MDFDGGALSIALSVIAVVASAVTTYLTFFDARYRAVAVVAGAQNGVQTSSSGADGVITSVGYRVFCAPTIILSNSGTRPVAATQLKLYRAAEPRGGAPAGEPFDAPLEEPTFLLEAGAVRHVRFEFGLPLMTNDFEKRSETWRLGLALIDHQGVRTDASIEIARFDFTIEPAPEGPSAAPILRADIASPQGPQLLAARGWLSRGRARR